MKNLHLPKSQGGAVLSIEFILLAIVGVASAIVAMVAALDILPVLQDYLHSWVTDFAQSTEAALRKFCVAENLQNHIVAENGPAPASGKATSLLNRSENLNYGSMACNEEVGTQGPYDAQFVIDDQ